MRSLGVETGEHGAGIRVSLSGDLDLSSAKRAEDAIQEAEKSNPRVVVVDLRNVTFMDSTGLRVMVSADKRAKQGGRRFVIVRGPAAVQRVFEITRLDERLELVDSPDDLPDD